MMIIWTTLLLIGSNLCTVVAAWFMFTDIKHPA
jgi:hypothetical protein